MKNVFTVLAILFFILALVGFQGNVKFMMKGEGLPTKPATRQGFIVGMFTVPVLLLAGGVWCGALAVRQRKR
jgi:hypothetical protein